jgi:hypothetical protein
MYENSALKNYYFEQTTPFSLLRDGGKIRAPATSPTLLKSRGERRSRRERERERERRGGGSEEHDTK